MAKKKLTKIGNSYGVILSKEILEQVGINEKGELEMEVRGNELVLRPTNLKDHKVMKAFLSVVKRYDPLLKRLAEEK